MIFYQSDELKEEKGADANKKERTRGFLLESSPRGRLPTLPLSQYHRRGEA